MSRLLIIGCGGVAGVAIHKCCQNSDVFTEIVHCEQDRNQSVTLSKQKLETHNKNGYYNRTGKCRQ